IYFDIKIPLKYLDVTIFPWTMRRIEGPRCGARVVAAPRCCRTALLPHRVVVAPQEGARCEGVARPYQSTYDGVRCSQLAGGSRGGLLALGPRRGVGRRCSGAEAAAEADVGPGHAAPAPRRSVP